MKFKVILVFLFIFKIVSSSEKQQELKRFKRWKNYNGPPIRYFRRPPAPYIPKGAYSFTPPPDHMIENPQSSNPYPGKPKYVSKQEQTLGEEDLNKIVKYLSKTDIDKLVNKLITQQNRDSIRYTNNIKGNEDNVDFHNVQDFIQQYNVINDLRPNEPAYNNAYESNFGSNTDENHDMRYNTYEDNANYNGPNSFNGNAGQLNDPITKDLPIIGDYTKKVEVSVNPSQSEYQVQSFAELPLMNYDSKLHTVSSYHAPRYTITSPSKSYLPSPKSPPIEPAPPKSEAKSQSDAHLKATKIWTHKSLGQAYYLHKDGRLTPERPKYGNS